MFEGKKAKSGAALLAVGTIFQVLTSAGVDIPAWIPQAVMGLGGTLGIWGVRARQDRDRGRP